MKIRHRVPPRGPLSDAVSEAYQRQVDRSTERLMREYLQAQARLEAAERRAEKASRVAGRHSSRKRVADAEAAWAIVELRRIELEKYNRMLKASPASAAHRGTKSFRPVPTTEGSL